MRNSFTLLKGAADACLFVEDIVTAKYLNSVFTHDQDLLRRIRIYTAGGYAGVRQFVRNFPNLPAYGWIDRDFRPRTDAQWQSNPSRVYQSSFLEIENCFLSGALLAQAFVTGTSDEIEADLRRSAERQTVWLACRATLAELHDEMQTGFVRTPSVEDIDSEEKARAFLQGFPWRAKIVDLRDDQLTDVGLNRRFDFHLAKYRADLDSDAWRSSFSGKEIFKAIVIPRLEAEHDETDVVMKIGELQVALNSLPVDIARLIAVLNNTNENRTAYERNSSHF